MYKYRVIVNVIYSENFTTSEVNTQIEVVRMYNEELNLAQEKEEGYTDSKFTDIPHAHRTVRF